MVTDLDLLAAGVNRYLVTPLNAFGLGGFVFDIEGETAMNLSTEITDHYLEDNTSVQDHIAVRPKKITLKSYVGELVYRQDDESNTFVQKAVQKLTVLSSFLPILSRGARQITDMINTSRNQDVSLGNITLETINKTTDYWAFVKNLVSSSSKQQQAYQYFKALMEQKILVSVQTPFEFVNNMAIESITAVQGEGSRFVSDFSIVLKQIRTVSILTTAANASRYITSSISPEDFFQGRAGLQAETLQQVGNMPGLPADGHSLLSPSPAP